MENIDLDYPNSRVWAVWAVWGIDVPIYVYIYIILVGGFNPSKKYESQLGWLFPILIYDNIWKNKKVMFQTTNQNMFQFLQSTVVSQVSGSMLQVTSAVPVHPVSRHFQLPPSRSLAIETNSYPALAAGGGQPQTRFWSNWSLNQIVSQQTISKIYQKQNRDFDGRPIFANSRIFPVSWGKKCCWNIGYKRRWQNFT